MITLRPSHERGHADHGWLNARHTFSFGSYIDPHHMGFRTLRVINEDQVAAGEGFGTHPHNDMEIITYMVAGELAHKDSMGHGSTLRRGDVQVMTAGKGIEHSEFNPSPDHPAHLLQIWIRTKARGLPPAYGEKTFKVHEEPGVLHLLVNGSGAGGALRIQQDASLYAATLMPGQALEHVLANARHAWVQVVRGTVKVNGATLTAGDGAALSGEPGVRVEAAESAEFLLFDLA